jgi:hypothetical protein
MVHCQCFSELSLRAADESIELVDRARQQVQDVKEDAAMYEARELAMSKQLVKEQKQGVRLSGDLMQVQYNIHYILYILYSSSNVLQATRELEARVEEAERLKGQLHDGEWERERQIRELERKLEQKDEDIEKLKIENEEQNLSIQVNSINEHHHN